MYFTDGFAIDTGMLAAASPPPVAAAAAAAPTAASATVVAPVAISAGLSASLPLPRGARGTFAMWIKPNLQGVLTGTRQTLLAGYAMRSESNPSADPVIDLGLIGEVLTLTIRRNPAAAPGAGLVVP